MNLIFNSGIANLLLKTNGGETEGESFCSLECFNCWWVAGAGVDQLV